MKADLHLHSRHSSRAADWVLRKLDFPASYSDPLDLYQKARAAGMGLVTLTDHNTIAGCLEIAHLPGVMLGEEVTTRFPEDECKIHILVWGITEAQHRDIQSLRDNLYNLQKWLVAEKIAHAVAHPLHPLNDKLGTLHLQKLALLFRHFETVNGRYAAILSRSARHVFGSLTPEDIEMFSARTGIEPTHECPWKKAFVGGSDDQSGTGVGRAFTEVPDARDEASFLEGLRLGQCQPCGSDGSALIFAQGTYHTAFEFAKARMAMRPGDPTTTFFEKMFSRFMEGKNPTEFSLGEKVGFLAQGIMSGKIFELAQAGNRSLWKDLNACLNRQETRSAIASATAGITEPERRTFAMANAVANQLGYFFFTRFISRLSAKKIFDSIESLIPLAPLAAFLSPYLHAFRQPKRDWLRRMASSTTGEVPEFLKNRKRAWFTDTLDDVNGVATTIRRMVSAGVAQGKDIRVLACRSQNSDHGIPLTNFQPIGEFALPEYELQRLSFPPFLQIADHLQREEFSQVIISTPGPLGLAALGAAKLLGLPTVGIYHTDFPQYVRILTDDAFMETLTWNFMHWFYSQCDVIYVNSEDYRRSWIHRGIAPDRLRILPRGLDTGLFHPGRKRADFWRARGLRDGELAMLFVGRVSKEKNLDLLVAATREIAAQGLPVRPVLVGDGPYMAEMKRLLPDAIFTGYLGGEDLAAAYASSDFFVFPSTTDTFGNVILEAQACGLPAIVSDVGGPRDLVVHGEDGLVTRGLDVADLASAIRAMATDHAMRARMSEASVAKVASRDWSKAFLHFWNDSPE